MRKPIYLEVDDWADQLTEIACKLQDLDTTAEDESDAADQVYRLEFALDLAIEFIVKSSSGEDVSAEDCLKSISEIMHD